MREIKFRAWDASEKEMVSWAHVIYDPDYWLQGLLMQEDVDEDDVLMQYTGLKDKNGVEIYEGDIMRIKLDHENCVVELDRDCWVGRWNESQFTTPLGTLIAGGNLVIGNIYENKDLI